MTPHLGLQFVDCDGTLVRDWQLLGSDGKAVATLLIRGRKVERFLSCEKAPSNAKEILLEADNNNPVYK